MALVLFFVPEPAVGLAEMKRVVKPGGIVSAYVWDVFEEGLPISEFHNEFRLLEYYTGTPLRQLKVQILNCLIPLANSAETARIPLKNGGFFI